MLKSIGIFTSLATLGVALIGDARGTATNIIVIVSIRGLSFLAEKVIDAVDRDMKGVVNFTGWCLCGVSFVKIIKAAQSVFIPIANMIG